MRLGAAGVGGRVLRRQPDGEVQVGQGRSRSPLKRADVAPIAIGLGIAGVQADGVGIVGHGLVVVALLKVGEAAVEIRSSAGGHKPDGRGQIGHGLVHLALDDQRQAAVAIGRGIFRVQLNRPAQQRNGRVGLALVHRFDSFAIGLGCRRLVGLFLGLIVGKPVGRLLLVDLLFLIAVRREGRSRVLAAQLGPATAVPMPKTQRRRWRLPHPIAITSLRSWFESSISELVPFIDCRKANVGGAMPTLAVGIWTPPKTCPRQAWAWHPTKRSITTLII